MRPSAEMVVLPERDRTVLEEIARRRVLGGSTLDAGDFEQLSSEFVNGLHEAIVRVGGRAFAKTAEKSAKNDVDLRPHETVHGVLDELTGSLDVLRQSLGRGGTGQRRTAQYIVFQPWDDEIKPECEFRVIIVGRHVAGITQQSWGRFVGHVAATAAAAAEPLIRLWYDELLELCPYADCTLDAFVTADGEARLIEVNPCGFWGSSGSGLFHWLHDGELLRATNGPLPVRYVEGSRSAYSWDVHAALA